MVIRWPGLVRSGALLSTLVLGAVLVAACGKKGPPLAPIVRIPAAIDTLRAQRIGSDIYLTMTVPARNVDATQPVDITRIEVYGYTGHAPPPRNLFAEAGALVAVVPVVRPPVFPPGTPPPPPPPAEAGATVGSPITVVDQLTADELVQGRIVTPPLPPGARARALPVPATAAAPPAGPLRRYYIAVGISSRGTPGPQPPPTEMPLFQLPQPPAELRLATSATNILVSWDRPFGILGYLFDAPLAPEPSPAEDPFAAPRAVAAAPVPVAPSGPTLFNVYLKADPNARPAAPPSSGGQVPPPRLPWTQAPEAPLNAAPLATTDFADPIAFGRERCYTVRSLRGTPPDILIGEPSLETCTTAVDTFAPAVPAGLAAVAAERSISLIWEPSSDADLAGYLVLRGAPGDATLQPLTPMPVAEARYVDAGVAPGGRYVYAIAAVDQSGNQSAPSATVEETAR